ncbi:unnamed protein product [Rhodiola kirilowii]
MERNLDSQLWHACAGGMVQMPKVNSKVFYFPQGHAEHAQASIDFGVSSKVGPLVPCRVVGIQFLADPETDEVYSKLRLVPVGNREMGLDGDDLGLMGSKGPESVEKPASFAKTLTQSDANNGGGFSVPRYCAETIFPRLDYTADPPVQTVIAKDVHGEIWKFRHIYRGTPRRHLLTTGWSTFVNQKKLVAGDSIVFLRTEVGELCVGIRRAKRGYERAIGGIGTQSGWSASSGQFISPYGGGGYSLYTRNDENGFLRNGCSDGGLKSNKKVKDESVIEAATLAANGQPFEVVYYPRACTPEFCVSASAVKAAMRIQWCPGMRFKMPFETEDSSRISWFMGTVSSVQVADPVRWPNSPWRLLQVTWDEPDLLQNVNRVSPWLVELVANMPVMNMSSFSPPRKKLRFPLHTDFPLDGQLLSMSSFSGNTLGPRSSLCCLTDNTPSGIQGARHAQFGISLSDIHFNNKLNSGLFPPSQQRIHQFQRLFDNTSSNTKSNESVSCLLSIGSSNHNIEKPTESRKQHFVLFGQPILTEQEISLRHSSESAAKTLAMNNSSDNPFEKEKFHSNEIELLRSLSDTSSYAGFSRFLGFPSEEHNMGSGLCKVYMEDDNVGRTLDLSVMQSYQELHLKLAEMFGIEKSCALNHVLYRNATGALNCIGDEPFSDFRKSAKKLIITINPGKYNGRLMGLGNAENGLCSSKTTGPLSILA